MGARRLRKLPAAAQQEMLRKIIEGPVKEIETAIQGELDQNIKDFGPFWKFWRGPWNYYLKAYRDWYVREIIDTMNRNLAQDHDDFEKLTARRRLRAEQAATEEVIGKFRRRLGIAPVLGVAGAFALFAMPGLAVAYVPHMPAMLVGAVKTGAISALLSPWASHLLSGFKTWQDAPVHALVSARSLQPVESNKGTRPIEHIGADATGYDPYLMMGRDLVKDSTAVVLDPAIDEAEEILESHDPESREDARTILALAVLAHVRILPEVTLTKRMARGPAERLPATLQNPEDYLATLKKVRELGATTGLNLDEASARLAALFHLPATKMKGPRQSEGELIEELMEKSVHALFESNPLGRFNAGMGWWVRFRWPRFKAKIQSIVDENLERNHLKFDDLSSSGKRDLVLTGIRQTYGKWDKAPSLWTWGVGYLAKLAVPFVAKKFPVSVRPSIGDVMGGITSSATAGIDSYLQYTVDPAVSVGASNGAPVENTPYTRELRSIGVAATAQNTFYGSGRGRTMDAFRFMLDQLHGARKAGRRADQERAEGLAADAERDQHKAYNQVVEAVEGAVRLYRDVGDQLPVEMAQMLHLGIKRTFRAHADYDAVKATIDEDAREEAEQADGQHFDLESAHLLLEKVMKPDLLK